MHGKLIEGRLVQAPACIVDGDRTIYNPSAEMLEANGWMPVEETPYPEATDGGEETVYESEWQEMNGQIVQVWAETRRPDLQENARGITLAGLDARVCALENAIVNE